MTPTPCHAVCSIHHLPRSQRNPFCPLTSSGRGQVLSQLPYFPLQIYQGTNSLYLSPSSCRLCTPPFLAPNSVCYPPPLSSALLPTGSFPSPANIPTLFPICQQHKILLLSFVILSLKQAVFLTSLLLPNSPACKLKQ